MSSATAVDVRTDGAGPSGPAPARAARPRRRWGRILPLLPAVAILLSFLAGPVIWSLYSSLTNVALTGPRAKTPEFVGIDNYIRLFQDPDFPNSLWLTIVFVVVSAIIGQNFLGLGIALLMSRASRAMSAIIGTVVVTAWVLPEIVAAFTAYAFFTDKGTFNQVLAFFGVEGTNWLYYFPMLTVILANIWRGTAFSMMVYQAALNDVPPEITEAAQIDGARGWQRLIYVTVPMIRRSISTNLMLITLQTLAVFTLVYVMTAGGPGTMSTTLPIFAYQQAFSFKDIGYGTAIATVMLLVGAAFAVIYIRALREKGEELS